jgi:hypothetical protein
MPLGLRSSLLFFASFNNFNSMVKAEEEIAMPTLSSVALSGVLRECAQEVDSYIERLYLAPLRESLDQILSAPSTHLFSPVPPEGEIDSPLEGCLLVRDFQSIGLQECQKVDPLELHP